MWKGVMDGYTRPRGYLNDVRGEGVVVPVMNAMRLMQRHCGVSMWERMGEDCEV